MSENFLIRPEPTMVLGVNKKNAGILYWGSIETLNSKKIMEDIHPGLIITCFAESDIDIKDLQRYREPLLKNGEDDTQHWMLPIYSDIEEEFMCNIECYAIPCVRGSRSLPRCKWQKFQKDLNDAGQYISQMLNNGTNVLVHCVRGLKRSLPVIASVLNYQQVTDTYTESFELAKKIRAEVAPEIKTVRFDGYLEALR